MEISFTRVALLAAALFFVGCDQNHNPPKPTLLKLPFLKAKPWVPSGVPASRALMPNAVPNLKKRFRPSWTPTISCFRPIKDSALMRFNDSQSLSPWPVSEAMAEIVTTSLRIGAKTDGAMDITVGPLVNLWGFGPEQQPVQIPSQEQIDAMKAKTGLQHLTVINQSHQQYLQKDLPDLYIDLSTVGEGYAADHPHA